MQWDEQGSRMCLSESWVVSLARSLGHRQACQQRQLINPVHRIDPAYCTVRVRMGYYESEREMVVGYAYLQFITRRIHHHPSTPEHTAVVLISRGSRGRLLWSVIHPENVNEKL